MKTLLKAVVGENYIYLRWARRRFGAWFALRSLIGAYFLNGGLVRLPVFDAYVLIRPKTSDVSVCEEILFKASYDVIDTPPEFIVDAGGHIGLATVYFAHRFPKAHIVVIEPDDANFALLERNTSRLTNVTRVKGGLWGNSAKLRIQNPDASPWAYNLTVGGNIEGLTVPDIMRVAGREKIDVLKIDIEGAELEVLRTAAAWIDRVGAIMIELHDRIRPGCSEALRAAIQGRGFAESRSGEYVVLKRRGARAAAGIPG
jgi:FkbM family methyltransferase